MSLIYRTIIPVINAPSNQPPQVCASVVGCGSTLGIGDTQFQFYFAPKVAAGKMIYGAGPVFTAPTGTPGSLGAGKWAAGPDAVFLWMPGPWVVGALFTQQWSFTGQANRPDTNNFLTQPFVNFNLPHGWAVLSAPIITADWTRPGNDRWTVPVGGGVTYTGKIASQVMSFQLAYYTNVVKPTNAPQTLLRLQWALIFPLLRGRPAVPGQTAAVPAQ
jgi:hypothetical protein